MIDVKLSALTAALVLGSLAAGAAAPAAACSPPFQEGKRYAIGDWVSAPSSIFATAANGDNERIWCSPPGVDECPSSGFSIVDHTAAHNQRYNYQCNSVDTLCSDEKYAPGTMFSGMAWTMMGIDPCSGDKSDTKLSTHLRISDGRSDRIGSVHSPESSLLLPRRMQSKSSKTCEPSVSPSTYAPTTASPSSSPSSTLSPTTAPSVSPTMTPTNSFQPTSKSGKASSSPVSKQPSTYSPTKARSIRCLETRSAKSTKAPAAVPAPKAMMQTITDTDVIQTTNETEIFLTTNETNIVQTRNETYIMQPSNGTEVEQMTNETEFEQTTNGAENESEILRHRPHLVPTDGLVH